jgi:predicted nucleic acid-binding protein
MRILLDTNIVVDIISKREGYEDSLKTLKYCEIKRADGFVSAQTVTDLIYILRKYIAPENARSAVRTLLAVVDVADVLKSDISTAFASEMKDFEDAVQASCAARIKADYIVTRNIKDFDKSPIPALLPSEMLEIMRKS